MTAIINALQGSQLGAIVACALGVEQPAPCFTSKAIITSDGFVQANFIDSQGVTRHSAFIGSYDSLLETLRDVCELLQPDIINDDQAGVLFNAVAYDWIVTDYRSQRHA